MKKVLYIGNPSSNNNAITVRGTLSKLLREEGYEVHGVSDKKNKVSRLFDMCLTLIRRQKHTDVVLIDTYSTLNFYYAVIVSGLCRLLNIPYIPILHGGNLPVRLSSSKWFSSLLFNNAKVNVAPSNYLLQVFNKMGYGNLVLIPNTLDMECYSFLWRKQLSPKLLWVRSFSKIYNPELALSILEDLMKKGYSPVLCMVGPEKDGSLAKCKQIAQEKGLPVTFTGGLRKEDWIILSEDYDIFINTTNFDNTPVSILEAMALGLPVVTTNVGGIPFLIEDKNDGILVPPNNTELFTNAIIELISNNDLANKISLNARKKVENFDWLKIKQSWVSLLSD